MVHEQAIQRGPCVSFARPDRQRLVWLVAKGKPANACEPLTSFIGLPPAKIYNLR